MSIGPRLRRFPGASDWTTRNIGAAEAESAADQLRALQRESGEDAGFAAGAYLTILDHFIKETAPSSPATNTPDRRIQRSSRAQG